MSNTMALAQQELMDRCIPRDTGWLIRMAFLDVTRGYGCHDFVSYISKQTDLNGDEKAALSAFPALSGKNEPICVGESGTLYRLIRFYLWKMGIDREIITAGSLTKRVAEMEATRGIIHWPINFLLRLDNGTSQWASAAVLMNHKDSMEEIPFYLQKTYDALKYWQEQRLQLGQVWESRTDPTITVQCQQYFSFLEYGEISIKPNRLGDCDLYCFLRAFGHVSRECGLAIWPQLQQHESNRIEEMESAMRSIIAEEAVASNDHRVVQATAMFLQAQEPRLSVDDIKERFINPDCVAKKWPMFWEFIAGVPALL